MNSPVMPRVAAQLANSIRMPFQKENDCSKFPNKIQQHEDV
jgi:hypothetical protein